LKVLRTLNLESLSLIGTQAGDETLRHVGKMTRLKRLRLDDTRVTDRGLAHLVDLPPLRVLGLSRTLVTDAGLGQLKRGSVEEALFVERTNISSTALLAMDVEPILIQVSNTKVRWSPKLENWLLQRSRLRFLAARGCGFNESEFKQSDKLGAIYEWRPAGQCFVRK
jgi:hypothetical protein